MKELPNTDKNLPPTQTSSQVKTTFTPATLSKNSPGPKGYRLPVVLVSLLLIAAVGGWLLFALNRPPIEISNGPSPTPTNPAQTTQPVVQPTVAQATGAASPNPATTTPGRPSTTGSKVQGYGVVISKVLNLRSGPNTDATVIKSLKSGDIVELTGRNGGWYQTSEGLWISASYMEVRQTRPEAESYARELASS